MEIGIPARNRILLIAVTVTLLVLTAVSMLYTARPYAFAIRQILLTPTVSVVPKLAVLMWLIAWLASGFTFLALAIGGRAIVTGTVAGTRLLAIAGCVGVAVAALTAAGHVLLEELSLLENSVEANEVGVFTLKLLLNAAVIALAGRQRRSSGNRPPNNRLEPAAR